ncbi:UBP-type zinc finger domain-containing protein [Desertivirga xinjiangensis]|uniref:UBP-type zinc finger domain-containing protein n=1 Tax=Desertivirga xinjiangensis TaxID=539206 RepID=UPI00210E6C15|nr:UBP-type zinc finger domain-containing protein [Pedobacter xinjiangensis]
MLCDHLLAVKTVKQPQSHECAECIRTGGQWLHLRTCQTCGEALCCDSSPNQHMRKHSAIEGHQVAASAEQGERWLWCFKHEIGAQY